MASLTQWNNNSHHVGLKWCSLFDSTLLLTGKCSHSREREAGPPGKSMVQFQPKGLRTSSQQYDLCSEPKTEPHTGRKSKFHPYSALAGPQPVPLARWPGALTTEQGPEQKRASPCSGPLLGAPQTLLPHWPDLNSPWGQRAASRPRQTDFTWRCRWATLLHHAGEDKQPHMQPLCPGTWPASELRTHAVSTTTAQQQLAHMSWSHQGFLSLGMEAAPLSQPGQLLGPICTPQHPHISRTARILSWPPPLRIQNH